ncbi:molybdopterin-guanine dinucleotide biosynthesis protein MobB [Metabacillus idriensis]|uniref:molybdopterin-guanine dinucleotide biosynthesis protein MobB n=1 Tax=Metabacillus idriensis TaxID=324768 RepID=UPI003D2B66E4
MEKLINKAAANGHHTGTIKHHGHGGIPDPRLPEKDSDRHSKAGAVLAGVEGDGLLQLNLTNQKWPLSKLVEIYQTLSIDTIFIEGYKKETFPKVVLIKNEKDLSLLKLSSIICVITWIDIENLNIQVPIYHIEDEEKYIFYIMGIVRDQHESGIF